MSGGAVPSKKLYSKCVCLIFQSTIAIPKKENAERHFRTVHRNYDTDFLPVHQHILYTSGGPGFARGIPRTIKYKCAIIAHHERKAGEMPIIAHYERKAGEMPIIAYHERKAGGMPISSVFMTKRCTIFTWINR